MKTWEKIWKLVCGMIKRSSFERYNTTSDIENLSIKLESYHRKALEIVATKKSRSFDKFLEFYIAALYDLEAQELNMGKSIFLCTGCSKGHAATGER